MTLEKRITTLQDTEKKAKMLSILHTAQAIAEKVPKREDFPGNLGALLVNEIIADEGIDFKLPEELKEATEESHKKNLENYKEEHTDVEYARLEGIIATVMSFMAPVREGFITRFALQDHPETIAVAFLESMETLLEEELDNE